MRYTIIDNPTYSNVYTVGIGLEPDSDSVKLFFSGVKLERYPEMIAGVLRNEGYYGELFGVLFYKDLDAEDFADGDSFEPHQVKVFNQYFGEEIIEAGFFKRILLDFANKLAHRYHNEIRRKGIAEEFTIQLEKLAQQVAGTP